MNMIDWKKRKQDLSTRIYNVPFANYYDLLDEEQRYVLDEIISQEQSMIEKLEADKAELLEALKRISIDKISQKIKVEEKLKGWGYTEKIKGYKEIIKILENKE